MHDLLFRNALVFDGTGSAPAIQDVAVTDGRIAEIGPDLRTSAREVIEADGLGLMPGIIDSHTHFDAQITWDPCVRPSPALGVTTAVIGNCGFTIAPCKPQHRDITMRNAAYIGHSSVRTYPIFVKWHNKYQLNHQLRIFFPASWHNISDRLLQQA